MRHEIPITPDKKSAEDKDIEKAMNRLKTMDKPSESAEKFSVEKTVPEEKEKRVSFNKYDEIIDPSEKSEKEE